VEDILLELLKEYGYIILFIWSIMEGESGLVMAGLLSHTGDMSLYISIAVGGLGGFAGDQLYFYIGRYNKNFVLRKMHKQRRKFALAHLLLKKYGWPIIFIQRFLYGLRTVIPISIGLTRYSAKQYAIINLFSGFVWASITIVPVYIYGKELLSLLKWAKEHFYFALPFALLSGGTILWYFHTKTKK
jgi:membrane protein DedA with SNARE-associated domain